MITADTNVFVYASDGSNALKQDVAQRIIARLKIIRAPLHVIGEIQNVLRRKLSIDSRLAAEQSRQVLASFDSFAYSRQAVGLALAQMASGRLSYWDALMLTSAQEAGCTTFISEDLQDGAKLFGLEIVNPFGIAGPSPRVCELLDLS